MDKSATIAGITKAFSEMGYAMPENLLFALKQAAYNNDPMFNNPTDNGLPDVDNRPVGTSAIDQAELDKKLQEQVELENYRKVLLGIV
jgi:hypothetical protein